MEGVDASVLESAVRAGHVPAFLSRAVEDIANNVQAAARVRVPVLAIHSYDDNRTPIADARRVMAAVTARASLVQHWRKGHSALLASTRPCDWAPVLAFVRSGALPAMAFDTVNACAVQAEELAAQRVAPDSVTQSVGRAVTDSVKQAATGAERPPQTKSTGATSGAPNRQPSKRP